MKRMIVSMIVFLIMLTPSGCAHRPTAIDQSLEKLRAMRRNYNDGVDYYNKTLKLFNDSYFSFDADRVAFNGTLSNDQIDAKSNWVKYRNKESGVKYLDSLSVEQKQTALEMEDREKLIIKQKKDLDENKIQLDRDWDEIEQFTASLRNAVYSQARRDAVFYEGLERLSDQTQRVSDGMMQRSRDLMLMRR